MKENTPTLTEACGPVFLFLTTFRRNSATSNLTIEALHRAVQHEIEDARRRCDVDRRLQVQFDRAFFALVATADQFVLSSNWPQRAGWTMRLLEMHYFKTAIGGKKFYALAQEVLDDPGEDAPALAELLFTCMALGFQGELMGETRELERRRRQLFEKARLAGAIKEQITPEAYGKNALRRAYRLPAVGILRMLLIAVGALLFAFTTGKLWTRWRTYNNERIENIDAIKARLLLDSAAADGSTGTGK